MSAKGQSNPLADIFQKLGRSDDIPVGRATTILTPLRLLGKPASVLQVSQGSLNGGAGQAQLSGYSGYSGPANAIFAGPFFQVHIDGHGTVRQICGINRIKIAHLGHLVLQFDTAAVRPLTIS